MPISYKLDREAAEWAFSFLLSSLKDNPGDILSAFLSQIVSDAASGENVRIGVLMDLTDPWSSGVSLALLRHLRSLPCGSTLRISLAALVNSSYSFGDSFFPDLEKTLCDIRDRHLLRFSAEDSSPGADSMVVLSLPSSMVEGEESHQVSFLSAARHFASFFSSDPSVSSGLLTRKISGVLSLDSLDSEAVSFAAFIEFAAWLLSDLLPGVRIWISHPGKVRSLQLNSRNSVLRSLFADADPELIAASVSVLEQTLKVVMNRIFSFMESVPVSLRFSENSVSAWKKAVDACGRYITVASEYDVTSAEVRESGLSEVRPVHRDSLEDTEEERLQRRLEQMSEQVDDEKRLRDEALSAVGPFRSVQAVQDCMRMCNDALKTARLKISDMSPDMLDHLTIVRQDRRIRLLEAAVSRCLSELSDPEIRNAGASVPADKPPLGILSAQAVPVLKKILADPADETSEKELRDHLPVLLNECSLPDARELFRAFSALCKNSSDGNPLLRLLIYSWNTCQSAVATRRFPVRPELPDIPLLPDILPSAPLSSLSDLIRLIPGSRSAQESYTADLRGLTAMLLLRQYKRRSSDEAEVKVIPCNPESPFVHCWLSARGASAVHLLCLSSSDHPDVPFAIVVPSENIFSARRLNVHDSVVPDFAIWYDSDSVSFRDPCTDLSEGDRSLLFDRFSAVLSSWPESTDSQLKQFVSAFRLDLAKEPAFPDPDDSFSVRIKAVCGLTGLPAYDGALCRISRFYEHFLDQDAVASCISGLSSFPASACTDLPDEVIYTWHKIPFARENSRIILEALKFPEEKYILSALSTECSILSGVSDDYRDELVRESAALLSRFPDALQDHRSFVQDIHDAAQKPVSDQTPEISWPWDPLSPSVRTVLSECLGETIGPAFASPFSDYLSLLPARGGEVVGDSLFSTMCRVMPWSSGQNADISPDAVLPPLSPELIRAVCFRPEGRMLVTSDFLSFDRPDDRSVRVILTLNGTFTLRLSRVFSDEEIVSLYAHDIPTLSLWPSMPFRPEDWHAYFVYAHIRDPYSVSVLTDESAPPIFMNGDQDRRVVMLKRFPVAFLFSREGHSIGGLLNLLPEPRIESSGDITVCIDFGSVGTSVVFASPDGRRPLQGPTKVRNVLINPASSADLLRQEFLPAIPVSALLPTASRIFRNVPGASPVPFVDGIILMSSDLQDVLSISSDALYTCLKWEEEKGRSGLLCLHQVMLMSAFQARIDGASSLSWRFALPDEMAAEGRESLRSVFCRLIEAVHQESGFPLDSSLPVSFASESTALGAYFRLCAWEDTRGGFMVLDIGASTADISLFLRGRDQAVRTCQIPLGVHYMLLPSLLRDPGMLQRDFAGYPDDSFCSDLSALSLVLSTARSDPASLRKARLALDHFLADHYSLLLDAIGRLTSSGVPSRFAAVLMLHLSYLMMLSGLILLQIAADPNKNDFLPEQMSLCMSGRGALLIEKLPEPVKTALWRFLTMFRNKRVASISLLFSAEKKMEIPVGLSTLRDTYSTLPPASSVPASLSVRPEELLPEFLLRFAREFPDFALLLFPDFYTEDYYHPFTSHGESVISAALDLSFKIRDTPRPYDSLASWIGNLLDMC